MAIQFKKTRLAAAVTAAAMGLGLSSAANAVVVVGGDNGWEVSFDGNINAFYVNGDYDSGYDNLGLLNPTSGANGAAEFRIPGCVGALTACGQPNLNTSRITSGFLPAFFSANIKSPTVNGMTGTARFSFAPQITNATTKNQIYGGAGGLNGGNSQGIQGSSIDMREVVVNLEGGFGTVSFGRTLSIFGRNAILKDMTLFGVGQSNMNGGAVTAGRIGRGYTYPNFNARFSYKTPNLAGFQAELGLYDPSIEQLRGSNATDMLNQTDTPRFEAEANYTTAFSGGSVNFWADALYQDIENQSNAFSGDVTIHGWGVGSEVKYAGFALTGYYYGGEGLGRSLQFVGGTACNTTAGINNQAIGSICESADNDGYYIQGTYTFGGKTKLGMSYGESTEDAFGNASVLRNAAVAGLGDIGQRDAELSMWTVGVYHDLNSWLKLIAEYSHSKNDYGANMNDLRQGIQSNGTATEADTFSVGTFFFW